MYTLPEQVTQFMEIFQSNNYQIYLVGGAVRELLLDRPIKDWDFTTNATPEQIRSLFPDSFYNNSFGTVGVPRDENLVYEVTTFRHESNYTDSRHPTNIEWAQTIEDDLSRRDFTINAMAYDGSKILDLYKGQEHLQQRLIVAVGDPDTRFQEDALRLMRAIRFASQLGFLIEDKTREAIKRNAENITHISWERIRDEFLKILVSPNPAEGILFLRSTNLLPYILPELDRCFAIEQKSPNRHHIYDVGTHLVMALKHCPSTDPITRFATLIHDIGKFKTFRKDEQTGQITFYNHEVVGAKQAEKIADRFRLSNKQKEKLVILVAHHQFTVGEDQSDKAVRRFIRDVTKEYIQDMLDLRTGDRLGSGAKETSWRLELFKKRIEEVQIEPFAVKDLKISGNDVMEILGIKPGPQIGKILNELFDEVVEKKLENEKEPLFERVKQLKTDQ
jgi:putative nucleotidyltransferase with HDIG domain